jgi:hypothetical protein
MLFCYGSAVSDIFIVPHLRGAVIMKQSLLMILVNTCSQGGSHGCILLSEWLSAEEGQRI